MKVRHHGDIDAQAAERRQPCRTPVERPGIEQLLGEVRVEVADRHLVAGQRFVAVVVRERQHAPLRFAPAVGAEVEVDCHPLPRAGRGVVHREVAFGEAPRLVDAPQPQVVGEPVWAEHLFVVPVAHADRERLVIILAIPDVA